MAIQSFFIATDNGVICLEKKMVFRGTTDSINKHLLRTFPGSCGIMEGYLTNLGT